MVEEHVYHEEVDEEEGFLYVREYGHKELEDEFRFLLRLTKAVAEEAQFRREKAMGGDAADILSEDVNPQRLIDVLEQEFPHIVE